MSVASKLAGFQHEALTWGTTPAERGGSFTADEFVDDPDLVCWRAVDVDAPAPTTFRWLCQLRLAPYSYDLVDNFARRSPRRLVPGTDDLELGQRFMTFFELVDFAPGREITLRLLRFRRAFGELGITYRVEPVGRRSRLLAKLVSRTGGGVRGALIRTLLPAGDLVMMRKQLLTLRALAEREVTPPATAPRSLLPPPRRALR